MHIYQVQPDRKSLPTRGIKSNPETWLNQKKARDSELWGCDTSKYWIIDNKLYDLSSYLDRHPGGRSWLTMTQGQDVTDFFIIHHLNEEKARSVLQKFYVGDTPKQVRRFTFEEDGLYRTVKREMLQEMTVEEIQSETKSKINGVILFCLLILSVILVNYSIDAEKTSYWPYIIGMTTSLFLISMVGIGHNFVHHKENIFQWCLSLTGFTHSQWKTMHCLSHHIYPNLELDYEAAALEPIGYFLRNKPENPIYTEAILLLVFLTIQPSNLILKMVVNPIRRRVRPNLWYLLPVFVFGSFYYTTGDLWYSLKLHLFIYAVFGFLFNRMLFCGHRLQELWTEGAERIDDFGEHTIYATNDTDTWMTGFFAYLFLAGFNIHTPHHFFPTADLSAHPKILKIIERVCKRKGIKHFETSRGKCLLNLSKGIIKRTPFVRK